MPQRNRGEDAALVDLMKVAGRRFSELMHEVERRAHTLAMERRHALDPRRGSPRYAALRAVTREVLLGTL